MKHEEYSWTTFDGLSVFAQWWAPEGPKAVIALVHGVGDHSGRFPRVVELLTEHGFAINAFDQRGHGRTGGPRVYVPGYEALLRDIDQHLGETRARFAGMPVYLYGHSFGGAQVLCYTLKRSPALAGVIASSPGLGSGVPQPAIKILLGRILSALTPTVRIPLGSPLSSLSHDPAWLETSKKDPYFQEGLSARLGIEMLTTNAWILSNASFPLPLLVMQGTKDQHVHAQRNIDFARGLSGKVTLKVWEGLGHELHNEVQKDEVIEFMRTWMEARIR
jgi:alpha-beta hydrolase superfamily lysophospholipase